MDDEMVDKDRIKLQKHLQVGCFCHEFDKTLTYLHQILGEICKQDEPTFAVLKDESLQHASSNVCLINYSLIEILCFLYRSQANTGRVCSCLATVIDTLLNEKWCLEKYLIARLLGKDSFCSYATTKALIEVQLSKSLRHEYKESFINIYSQLAALLRNVDDRLLNILSVFEHTLISLKSTVVGVQRYGTNCALTNVQHTQIVSLDILYEILDGNISLPLLLKNLADCDKEWREDAIQTLLRILLLGVDKCNNLKRIFLKHFESVFDLMTETKSLLIFERCCVFVKEIIDSKAVTGVYPEDQIKLANHFLQKVSYIKLFSVICDSKENGCYHGFGSPLSRHDSPKLDRLPADLPCFQSFLLLYLSSLFTTTSHIRNRDQSDELRQALNGLANVEKLWKSKIPSASHPLALFEDQDDLLVEAMLYSLEIFKFITRLDETRAVASQFFNPHSHFFRFLRIIGMDYQVLLDLLISEETCFLLYFVRYLKFTLAGWNDFLQFQPNCELTSDKSKFHAAEAHLNKNKKISSHQPIVLVDYEVSEDESDDGVSSVQELNCATQINENAEANLVSSSIHREILDIFNSLTSTIEKQTKKKLFPYNVTPLIRLLRQFQSHPIS